MFSIQVQVTQPPGPGCEVNRIPKEYTWFIRECIPSGKYSIVNTLNKSIYLPVIDPEPTKIPVVADPGSLTVSRFTDRLTNSSLTDFYLYYSGKLSILRITIITSLHRVLAIVLAVSQSRRSKGGIFSMWTPIRYLTYG